MEIEIGPPQPRDRDWIIAFHETHYTRTLGYDAEFVKHVTQVVDRMFEASDPTRERIWVARVAGRSVGSITCWDLGEEAAKLRIFFVDPEVQGLGIGRALIERCIGFAEGAGYRSLSLVTTAAQEAARRLYARAGFEKLDACESRAFGAHQIEERWRLTL